MTTTETIATISIFLLIVGVYFFNKYVIIPAEKLAEEREDLHSMSWPDYCKKYGLEDWE